jgi:O-acetylserine/cysteine efflux transporter
VPLKHLAIVYLVTLVWGANFIAVATGLTVLPPFLFTTLRFLIVISCVLLWMKPPLAGQWTRLATVGVLTGAVHFSFFFFALQRAQDVSSIAILLQTYVPMTTLMGVLVLGERIGWRTATAIGVAFLGVLLVSFDPIVFTQLDAVVLALAAALAMAVATVMMRGIKGLDPLSFQGWTAIFSLPLLIPATLLLEPDQWRLVADIEPKIWSAVAFSALGASIIGHGLMFWLVQRHPVSTVSPHLLLAPIFAVFLGVVVWGDQPGWRLYAGGLMVLSGVLVVAIRSGRRRILP